MNIQFKKAEFFHKKVIFSWLEEPHVHEFWDNSEAHRDDILHCMQGRPGDAPYFGGIFTYWIGAMDEVPYAFLLTSHYSLDQELPDLHKGHITEHTYSLDFCIGNKDFLGKGYGAPTLQAFMLFFKEKIDNKVDTFLIDPDALNPRAIHVYQKAGFSEVGSFEMGEGVFAGQKTILMKLSI